ncbi:MAG: ferrous iron transport protein B [Bacteroidota bacterium]
MKQIHRIGLIGNPNSGKSSLFNLLTGLRQKVGNFPGVTVAKKSSQLQLAGMEPVQLIDFPGTYSCYPTSIDERVVVETLIDDNNPDQPEAVIYVADLTRLDKQLLLLTQLVDLDLPLILVLNMADLIDQESLQVDAVQLGKKLGITTLLLSTRTEAGLPQLQEKMAKLLSQPEGFRPRKRFHQIGPRERDLIGELRSELPARNDYQALLLMQHAAWLGCIEEPLRHKIQQVRMQHDFHSLQSQVEETMWRYDAFEPLVKASVKRQSVPENFSDRLDGVLTNRWLGPLIFLAAMLLVFQALFSWAGPFMDGIEWLFNSTGHWLSNNLPAGWLRDLLTEGIIPGLAGVLVFAPQIAILFLLIGILEEVGYLARAAYLFDSLMQRVGLNGRSVVALISGHACAIPAIMSTRTISNWKERLLTILVTPLTSCSARLPVYAILITFAVPEGSILGGWIGLRGLAFAGLYFLGIFSAIFSAFLFKFILKTPERSYLMLELPEYRMPVWRNVFNNVYQKVKVFVREAGQVILVISMLLWALASYGPGDRMATAEAQAQETALSQNLDETQTADLIGSARLEASYAGHLGHLIEPAIAPLGYDWKIGIALISSFAAREVFVGSLATIYSVGSADEEGDGIRLRMAQEINPQTRQPRYDQATSWSLLIFYVFAMMCMSTLAVTKRETGGWKWPIIQLVFMTVLAYVGAWVVYQILV